MGARVANSMGFREICCLETEGLTRIFTDDTDQEQATASYSVVLPYKRRERFVQDDGFSGCGRVQAEAKAGAGAGKAPRVVVN
jgi:hypothetical protein